MTFLFTKIIELSSQFEIVWKDLNWKKLVVLKFWFIIEIQLVITSYLNNTKNN